MLTLQKYLGNVQRNLCRSEARPRALPLYGTNGQSPARLRSWASTRISSESRPLSIAACSVISIAGGRGPAPMLRKVASSKGRAGVLAQGGESGHVHYISGRQMRTLAGADEQRSGFIPNEEFSGIIKRYRSAHAHAVARVPMWRELQYVGSRRQGALERILWRRFIHQHLPQIGDPQSRLQPLPFLAEAAGAHSPDAHNRIDQSFQTG